MAFKVYFKNQAYRDFACLDKKTRQRIARAINTLHDFSPKISIDIKKLKTPFEGYRLRIGDLRILFTVDKDEIKIYSIKHRKDAYK